MSFQTTNNKLFETCQWCNVCMLGFLSIHQSQCAVEVLLLQLRITELFQISKTNIQKLPKNLSAISAVSIFGFYPNSVCSWGWECDVHDCSVTFALLLPPTCTVLRLFLGFFVLCWKPPRQFVVSTIATQNRVVLMWCIRILLLKELVAPWKTYQSGQVRK